MIIKKYVYKTTKTGVHQGAILSVFLNTHKWNNDKFNKLEEGYKFCIPKMNILPIQIT